jgi:hypothetical protein
MSDQYKGILVTFDGSLSEKHAKAVATALELFQGVIKVELIKSNFDDAIIQNQVRHELGQKLLDIIYPK